MGVDVSMKNYIEHYKRTVKELKDDFESDGMSTRNIAIAALIRLGSVVCVIDETFHNFIAKRKISPFLKELILVCSKWSLVGPLAFLVLLFLKFGFGISDYFLQESLNCLLGIPLVISGFIALFMSTPALELLDKIFGYRIVRQKNVMIGSIDSFRTTIDCDFKNAVPDPSEFATLDEKGTMILPVKLYCKELPGNHIAHSSTPQVFLEIRSDHDFDADESADEIEITDPYLVNTACSDEERKELKLRVKVVLNGDIEGWFEDLYELEPSLEFRLEYLHFSKLLTGIYPIEGYEYAEGVPEILENITNAVHPWLKRKKK